MRNFIKILLFAAILLLVNFILDGVYKHIIVNSSIDGRKDRQFEHFKDTMKYLIMGDSYMQCSINPEIFDSSFNYASAYENYTQTYYKLKTVVETNHRKPACIILPVSISSFSSFRSDKFKFDPYWIRFVDYFELADIKHDRRYIYKWIAASYFSYAGNYEMIFEDIATLGKYKRTLSAKGYIPRFENFDLVFDKVRAGADRAELYLKGYDPIDKNMVLYFRKILEYCNNCGIRVILISLPVTWEYYLAASGLNPPVEFYRKIANIYNHYPCVIHYYDYQKLFFDHPEYFRNPDHMNNNGAPVFSAMLNKLLN